MKHLFLLIAACSATVAQAQDVIVKRDGSTILTKVLEVNQADIKYKKFSNQQGPTYTINKSEVMAINYESGDKDTFEDEAQAVVSMQVPANTSTPFGVNPNLAEDNLRLVKEFNARKIEYAGKKQKKDYWYETGILRIEEGSIMESPELKMDFSIKETDGKEIWDDGLVATLYNKTNKTIYVDLANCFLMEDGNAHPYYIPTATSTGHGGSTGGSVNLGAVTGAVGIGGALGSIANGVNVGGSSTNIKTTTTYSQRIVSIPPMASLSLAPQSVYRVVQGGGYWQGYHSDVSSFVMKKHADFFIESGFVKEKNNYYYMNYPKRLEGEIIDVPQKDNGSLAIHITYSFDENITSSQTMRCGFYLSQIVIGNVSAKKSDFIQIPKPLLCFRIWGRRLLK